MNKTTKINNNVSKLFVYVNEVDDLYNAFREIHPWGHKTHAYKSQSVSTRHRANVTIQDNQTGWVIKVHSCKSMRSH